jgi:alpha-glucosidase
VRFPTRICAKDDAKVRCAQLLLLGLRGTSVLYYGDELGMRQVDIPPDRVLDVDDRDGARTPMPWGDAQWRDPWLPFGDNIETVAAQRADPASTLTFCREAIALRRAREDLAVGAYAPLEAPAGVWAWRRGERTAVALNLSGEPARLELDGSILLSTAHADGRTLEPWEGVVLEV